MTTTLTNEDFKRAMDAQGFSFVMISVEQAQKWWNEALAEHNSGGEKIIVYCF